MHIIGLLSGDVVPLRFSAQTAQVVPGGETADDPPFGGILDLAGFLKGPSFESGESLVTTGQDPAGHQDLAQVVGGAAGQVPVEVGVAGWLAGLADLGEDVPGGGAPGQPLHEPGWVAGGEELVDRFGVRVESALVMGQQAEEVLTAGAAGAEPVVVETLGGLAFRAGLERCRMLAVARAAERAAGEPGGDGAGVAAG